MFGYGEGRKGRPEIGKEEKKEIKEEFSITTEQRKFLMDYLKKNSDSVIGEDLEMADDNEDQVLASSLLEAGEDNKNGVQRFDFEDSSFRPDAEKRNEAFREAGISDDLEIRRHDIVVNSSDGKIAVKVIDLVKKENITNENGEIEIKRSPVNGGVIYLGRITFDGGNDAKYVSLTEDEKNMLLEHIAR